MAGNLYQLNANEVPLSLHYGFEGRIIILHKNPYRWRLQNDAKCNGHFLLDDAHAHRKSILKSVQIADGVCEKPRIKENTTKQKTKAWKPLVTRLYKAFSVPLFMMNFKSVG